MKRRISLVFISIMIIIIFAGIGTYAWFAKDVASKNNTVKSGILVIDTESENPSPVFWSVGKWNIGINGKWVPGTKVSGRRWTVVTKGNIPAKVYGVSANVKDFQLPTGHPYSQDISKEKFKENFILTVKTVEGTVLFKGSLLDLESVQSFDNENYFILYNNLNDDALDLFIEGELSTNASNEIKGTSATIDFSIHATQIDAPIN